MDFFLFATALAVSADSFVCGISIGFVAKKNYIVVLGVALTVFCMCLIADCLGTMLSAMPNETVAALGGLVLIGIAVYNFFSEKERTPSDALLRQSLIVGFAVGLDGACAAFSLTLSGYSGVSVPALIALLHAAMIYLGAALSQTRVLRLLQKADFLPPYLLIALGLYKLSALF